MKSIINALQLDHELVNTIKSSKPNEGHLYNQLISGKITLKEYLKAL